MVDSVALSSWLGMSNAVPSLEGAIGLCISSNNSDLFRSNLKGFSGAILKGGGGSLKLSLLLHSKLWDTNEQ